MAQAVRGRIELLHLRIGQRLWQSRRPTRTQSILKAGTVVEEAQTLVGTQSLIYPHAAFIGRIQDGAAGGDEVVLHVGDAARYAATIRFHRRGIR